MNLDRNWIKIVKGMWNEILKNVLLKWDASHGTLNLVYKFEKILDKKYNGMGWIWNINVIGKLEESMKNK